MAILAAGTTGCSDARKPLEGVAQVAALRVQIEHWAGVAKKETATLIQLARSLKDDQRIAEAERRIKEAEALYTRTQDDFDGLIHTVIMTIKANTDIEAALRDPQSAYSLALGAIVRSANAYILKAKQISDNATVAAAMSLAGDVALAEISDAINQAAIAVYHEYQPATKELQEQIVVQLNALSLRKWETLPVEEPAATAAPVVVEPWNKRAEPAARALITATVAESVISITHPTGKNAVLSGVTVKDLGGDRMAVEIGLDWKGGFLGLSYQSKVEWIFNKTAHENARMTADNAYKSVAAENAAKLNEYFMQTLFPQLKRSLD